MSLFEVLELEPSPSPSPLINENWFGLPSEQRLDIESMKPPPSPSPPLNDNCFGLPEELLGELELKPPPPPPPSLSSATGITNLTLWTLIWMDWSLDSSTFGATSIGTTAVLKWKEKTY